LRSPGGHSEAALKARYCAQMMAASTVLASTAPDDFRRRVLARSVFVYCHEFIPWARRAKNELRRDPQNRATVRILERELDALERRDWGPYEEIRHRIAAHRQSLADDPGQAIQESAERWTDISDATVRILSEDARGIWNRLADVSGIPRLEQFPPISEELVAAIVDHGYERTEGLVSGVGSFDGARTDALHVVQGGDLGELNRQIVDAVRNNNMLGQLFGAVNGHEPYARVVLAAAVTEACTLVDLVYGQPQTTDPRYRQDSLLQLLERTVPASSAIAILRSARDALSPTALATVRSLRNTFGAHIDDDLTMTEILNAQEGFDADAVNTVVENVGVVLAYAARAEMLLRPIAMHDVGITGLSLVEPPEGARPYGDETST
jgi:hypothetical protein